MEVLRFCFFLTGIFANTEAIDKDKPQCRENTRLGRRRLEFIVIEG
jgi:hypothetical protein